MKSNKVKRASILLLTFVLMCSSVAFAQPTGNLKTDAQTSAPLSKDVIFEDGFETYTDWLIDFPPWTTIDVNGDPTFGHSAYTWPHQYDPYAFIIFNPSTTTPPMTGDPDAQPHSGMKYCAGFNNDNVGYLNDDWLITPQLGPADYDTVNFWAKSYLDTYNYELFEVCVSTTDTNPSSFTVISPTEQPGHLAWEEFSYSLDTYDGQSIYIGIHMISIDSWFLMIDDFVVTGGAGLAVNPGGPYTGNAGEAIQFTGSVSGGTPPYTYLWDFGNGDTSDEQNPLYTYPAAGSYDVILSVTDDEGLQGTGATTAEIAGPILSIPTVNSGLFKLKPTIRNIGAPATNVEWRITFTGGAFINQITEGSGVTVPSGGTTEIASGLILGIGATEVLVEAWIDGGPSTQRTQTGFVFLFFIKMNAGGGI